MLQHMLHKICRDKINLIQQQGVEIKNIPASVQGDKIRIFLVNEYRTLAVNEGDKIIRNLSNGVQEKYVVSNAAFSEGFPGQIPANYNITVRKEGIVGTRMPTHIVMGNNSKIMVNSTDNSINVQITKDNMWEQLAEVIKLQCNNQSDLLKLVIEMKGAQGTSKFKEKYQAFITLAANHMAVFAPFMPFLSSLL